MEYKKNTTLALNGIQVAVIFVLTSFLMVNGQTPQILRDGHPSNPGLRLRFTYQGMKYLETLAMRIVNRMIPRVKLPPRRQMIDNGRTTGFVDISGTEIVGYRKPKAHSLQLEPPNKIIFRMDDMGLRAQGKFSGMFKLSNFIPIDVSGDFTVTIGNVDFVLVTSIFNGPKGYPQVQVHSCQAKVEGVDIEMYNSGALMDVVLRLMRKSLVNRLQPQLEEQLCGMTSSMVNENANEVLRTMPIGIPLGDNVKLGGLLGQAIQRKGLWLDYRMIRPPVMSHYDLVSDLKGEVSYQGRGGTPFSPALMHRFPNAHQRMLQIQGSDYIVNSLLYHAWRNKLMDFYVEPRRNPALGSTLRTTCDDLDIIQFCIGDIIPAFAKQYPGHEVHMQFTPTDQPVMIFKPGKATLTAKGQLEMFLSNPRTRQSFHAASNALDLLADAKMQMRGQKVVGNLTIHRLDIRLIRSNVPGLTSGSVGDLSALSAEILQDVATENMQQGIPLPTVRGLKLRNPELTIHDRAALVQTYFLLNEGRFQRMISRTINSRRGRRRRRV